VKDDAEMNLKQLEYYKRLREVYKYQIEVYIVALEELENDILPYPKG